MTRRAGTDLFSIAFANQLVLPIFRTMVGIILAQLASTLFMTGLIWFVQVVHYPLFAEVGADRFVRYESLHTTQTGFVVMPVMVIELLSAIALVALSPAPVGRVLPIASLSVLAMVWLTTAVFSVPAHTTLGTGFVEATHHSLVLTNWLRTLGWTVRSGLVLWMTARLLS